MTKDPAFLFYVSNWIAGTMYLTHEQKGAYIDLLVLQFQRKEFTLRQAEIVLGEKTFESVWPFIHDKFRKEHRSSEHPVFYNERLRSEILKREEFSRSQKERSMKRWSKDSEPIPDESRTDPGGDPEKIPIDLNLNLNLLSKSQSEIWNMFITGFNEITGRKFKGDEKARRQFFARLKQGYTPEQFGLAIVNCFNDKFHLENPMYLTPEFITRQDKLEKYLNYKASPTERDRARDIILKYFNQLDNEQTSEE